MRKSFDGLWAEASERLKEDPFSGALFVFANKRRDRIKVLYWDGSGVWVFIQASGDGPTWPTGSDTRKTRSLRSLWGCCCAIDLKGL